MQNQNKQAFKQENTNATKQKDQYERQNQQRETQKEKEQYQTRRNYKKQRNESSQSIYSDSNSYRTRNSRSNSKSKSRYRRNYNRNKRNNRQYNQNNYNNNRNQFYRNNQNQRYQGEKQQKSKAKQMLQDIRILQEQTCKFQQNTTCRDFECERKHFEMVPIMNIHQKLKSRRIKNNIVDHNSLSKEIEKQDFNVVIQITRQMNITEIQEFKAKKAEQLEEQKINNIKIKMAVKDSRNTRQEIQHIRNSVYLEIEKDKDTVNSTQAELIATHEILKQMQKEEFINIRQAFIEINREYEYQNENSREKHIKQIEQMKELNNQKNKQMEVEDNNLRISHNTYVYKPIIQENQFNNMHFEQQIQQSNISDEEKVKKPNTSSGEDKNQTPIEEQSLLNMNNKNNKKQQTLHKQYLTEQKIDLNKEAKDIPMGAYLILLMDAIYINEIKLNISKEQDRNSLPMKITAFAESISTHALGTIQYRLESDKIKLDSNIQPITKVVRDIIQSKKGYV
ncbi:hypothetical protein ABPG72_018594 [Tetrahymena utriculariae]